MTSAPRSIAILQSNYIPWKGYFDLIGSVDVFVLYDIVQYTKNDWRNRNRIKTSSGPAWLTIPVRQSGRSGQRIDEVEASDDRWRARHWKTIEQAYRSAPFFSHFREPLEALYLESSERSLSAINWRFIEAIVGWLEINTTICSTPDIALPENRVERLVTICAHLGATRYVTGPAAKEYLNHSAFEQAGIAVDYFDYSGYPEYPQLYPPFEHSVSALDLLFSAGPNARQWLSRSQPAVPR